MKKLPLPAFMGNQGTREISRGQATGARRWVGKSNGRPFLWVEHGTKRDQNGRPFVTRIWR